MRLTGRIDGVPSEVWHQEVLGPQFAYEAVHLLPQTKQLRALLQEQESLSGIGGAYADEILFAARLDPLMHAADLDADRRETLFRAMRTVLTEAFEARRGIPIDRQKAEKVASMRVHGRTGEPCPEGDGVVADIPGTKGGGQYCPECQES